METLAVFGISAILLLVFAQRADEPRAVRQQLSKSDLPPLAELADGKQGTVAGVVEAIADATLASPLANQPCVYWCVVIEELGARDYVELGRLEGGVPFLLRSSDGAARVVPEHASIALPARVWPPQHHGSGGMFATLLARVRPPSYASSLLRFTEYVLELGVVATVRGHVSRETDPEGADAVAGGYRDHLPTRPVLSGTKRKRMLIGV